MKKTILSIFLIIIAATIYASAAIMLSDYKQVFDNFSSLSRFDPDIAKNVEFEIRKFPKPAIIVKEAIDKDKIEIYNVEINFSPLSILSFAPKVTSLNIGEVKIYTDHGDIDLMNHSEFISELLDKEAIDLRAFIHRLEFTEAENVENNIVIKDFIFDGISKDTKFSGNLDYIGTVKGYFKFDQEYTKASNPEPSGTQSNSKDDAPEESTNDLPKNKANDRDLNTLFYLSIENTDLKIELHEIYKKNYLSHDKTDLRAGKVDIKAKNIIRWMAKFVPDIQQFTSNKNSDEEIEISFIIDPENHWTYFKNIKISSDSIEGSGKISINKNNTGTNRIDLNFKKIDLDNLKKSQKHTETVNGVFVSGGGFDFSKRNMITNFSIDEFKINESSTLSNITLQADAGSGRFSIKKFSGDMGDQGRFKISGYVNQNEFRSIFNGNIALSHTDLNDIAEYIAGPQVKTSQKIPFVLLSDIKFSSVDISLQNISIRTDDTELNGSLSVKFIGNSPRVNSNLRLLNANVDKDNFPGLRYIKSSVESLVKDSKEDSYLGKFAAIRNINSIGNFNISLSTLTLYESLYKNIDFTLSMLPGELVINKLYISYDSEDTSSNNSNPSSSLDNDNSTQDNEKNSKRLAKDFIDLSINLKARGIRPIADIVVNDASLRIGNFKLSDMLDLRSNILRNIALDKFQISTRGYFSKLYNDDFDLGRVLISLKTKNNLIDISKFDADIFGGRIKTSGSILLDPFTVNLVYGLNSASIDDLSKTMLNDYIKTGGVVSASGMWTTNGKTLKELLYNLYTKSTIVTKDLSVDNFSIDDFILKINDPDYKLYNLEDDVRQAILTGSTKVSDMKTEFELNEGVINLSGLKLKTKYSSAIAAILINIYDLSINMNSKFSFLVNPTTDKIPYSEYLSSTIDLRAKGDLLSPKKETIFNDLVNVIKERAKNTERRRRR